MEYSSYEKSVFTITRLLNLHFLKLWHFNFSNFQTTFVKFFMKEPPGLKELIKFCRFTNIYDLKFFDNETTDLWIIFQICIEEPFAS